MTRLWNPTPVLQGEHPADGIDHELGVAGVHGRTRPSQENHRGSNTRPWSTASRPARARGRRAAPPAPRAGAWMGGQAVLAALAPAGCPGHCGRRGWWPSATLLRWHRRLVAWRWAYPRRADRRSARDADQAAGARKSRPGLPGDPGRAARPGLPGRRAGREQSAQAAGSPARAAPRPGGPGGSSGGPPAGPMLAGDFFHAGGAVTLKRLYAFFVIETGARHVPVRGVTARPDGPWTAPAARTLPMDLGEHADRCRFVTRDRAGQFTEASGTVRSGAGIDVVTIPPPSPPAVASADRRVRTVRAEVTGRMPIAGARHLRLVPGQYAAHDHRHRPHRGRGLRPPDWHGRHAGERHRCGRGDTAAHGHRRVDQRGPASSVKIIRDRGETAARGP